MRKRDTKIESKFESRFDYNKSVEYNYNIGLQFVSENSKMIWEITKNRRTQPEKLEDRISHLKFLELEVWKRKISGAKNESEPIEVTPLK